VEDRICLIYKQLDGGIPFEPFQSCCVEKRWTSPRGGFHTQGWGGLRNIKEFLLSGK